MIVDSLLRADLYYPLSESVRKALIYLRETDFTGMEPGRYDVDGDRIFAIVQAYRTLPADQVKWESHRRYLDIQYMVEGAEYMGISRKQFMNLIYPYDTETDVAKYMGKGDFIRVEQEQFTIFFPNEIHMPKVQILRPEPVLKVVMKVQLNG